MAESLKYFRQKKGTWIWIYDMETNRKKKEPGKTRTCQR